MPRYAWMTDVHLNFIDEAQLSALIAEVTAAGVEGLLLGGDIAEAPTIERYLRQLAAELPLPVYFVLGNHDYYKGSIKAVRKTMRALDAEVDNLHWLPACGAVELTPQTALVGHGGWGDGRLGDFLGSTVMLNDYVYIDELAGIDLHERLARLNALGDEAAAHIREVLPAAAARYQHIVFLTHVPPFREACVYDGKISDDNWMPHFSCKVAGGALRGVMTEHPACSLTVLCGHTHGSGSAQILPNLTTRTGAAAYGRPEIQEPLLRVV